MLKLNAPSLEAPKALPTPVVYGIFVFVFDFLCFFFFLWLWFFLIVEWSYELDADDSSSDDSSSDDDSDAETGKHDWKQNCSWLIHLLLVKTSRVDARIRTNQKRSWIGTSEIGECRDVCGGVTASWRRVL